MGVVGQVPISPASPERFRELLGADYSQIEAAIESAGRVLAGRVVWHVNSTARGGGVAEMLQSLLAYARGAGVDARWALIDGDARVLPDHEADPQPPARRRRATAASSARPSAATYEWTLRRERRRARRAGAARATSSILHDPQTAGLARAAAVAPAHASSGAATSASTARTSSRASAWAFLRALRRADADAYVFSRAPSSGRGSTERSVDRAAVDRRLLPEEPGARARSRARDPGHRRARRARLGDPLPVFVRHDGSPGRVDRRGGDRSGAPDPRTTPRSWSRSRAGTGSRTRSASCAASPSTRRARRPPAAGRARRWPRSPTTPRAPRCSTRCAPSARALPAARSGPRPPRLPADGRRRGERGDRQRDPAARGRRASRRASPRASA